MAQLTQASGTATKVMIVNKPAVTKASEIPHSMGDEAGVAGGVSSGTNMQKVSFKKGSAKVKMGGQPVVYLTTPSGHNSAPASNAPGGLQVAPSQAKVIVAP